MLKWASHASLGSVGARFVSLRGRGSCRDRVTRLGTPGPVPVPACEVGAKFMNLRGGGSGKAPVAWLRSFGHTSKEGCWVLESQGWGPRALNLPKRIYPPQWERQNSGHRAWCMWRIWQPIWYQSRGRRTQQTGQLSLQTMTASIRMNGDLRSTMPANGHCDCLAIESAELTAFQNYPSHLFRTLRTCTTAEPWIDIRQQFPIPTYWDIREARCGFPLYFTPFLQDKKK